MAQRILPTLLAVPLLLVGGAPLPVKAENAMGYRLLSAQEATALPHNHGSLGMDVERSQEITDGGMTFDIIRIKQVLRGSPGAQAGFRAGDQVIAVDGRVFPTLVSFAGYIGALSPGTQAIVDYIPVGGGPAQAQRVPVTVGGFRKVVQAKRRDDVDWPFQRDQGRYWRRCGSLAGLLRDGLLFPSSLRSDVCAKWTFVEPAK
jgi:S1-C subfamily serine protease